QPTDHMVRLALDIPEWTYGRGRPLATWLTKVQNDLKPTTFTQNPLKR
ncbi:jg25769, partial [Pararge aegeria aegeria]